MSERFYWEAVRDALAEDKGLRSPASTRSEDR